MTVRTVRGWALAILTVLFFAIAGTIGAPAARADGAFTGSDRLTPRPEAVAPIGQLRLVATFDVPEADQGCVATFTVYAANGDSVHQANYGVIVSNGDQADVLFTESEANVDRTRLTDRTLELGETISLYNVIGPWTDGDTTRPGYVGTSVDYRVSYTCNTTTTTTAPSSTTTIEPPSTTTSSSTSTTSSSTTSMPPAPPTTAGTPPSTNPPPVTVPYPSTSQVPPVTITELPFTADHSTAQAGAGFSLLGLGLLGLYLSMPKGRHQG